MASHRWIDTSAIDEIFTQTLVVLRHAREQMFEITEAARAEYERLQRAVEHLKAEAAACIENVDRLEKEARKARAHLAHVSQDFGRYSEREIDEAYQAAEKLHVELSVARERERSLRKRRDELERSLVNLKKMVEKAEAMVSQVSVAVEYLTGNLEKMADRWEGMKARYAIGERVIKAQEEERRRVAREIHDGPAQAMANVVLRAEICERLLKAGHEEAALELAHLKTLVKESLREIRRIIFNLRPMTLDDLGLVPTLYRYLENLRDQEGIPVEFSVVGEEASLPSMMEVALFRFVQEAVNNARKHAKASRIQVTLEYADDRYVVVTVEDDGVGFDPGALETDLAQRESFGLMSMRERIELLEGEFSIDSSPGCGTRVRARVNWGGALGEAS